MATADRQTDGKDKMVRTMIRGACPSLAEPMATGDGLLVRLRPLAPGLTVDQYRALAETAKRNGNGLIEVTTRGSLQLRGIRRETLAHLTADIHAAGIDIDAGVTIEMPPLSGLFPGESGDASAMTAALRRSIAALDAAPLAPKFSIIVDAGSHPGLAEFPADIRLTAVGDTAGPTAWLLAIAGTDATARCLAVLPTETVIAAVLDIIRAVAALGPRSRTRDLDADRLHAPWLSLTAAPRLRDIEPISPIGLWNLAGSAQALGLGLPFGQIHADELTAFLDVAEEHGTTEIRSAPHHCLLLLGLDAEEIRSVQLAAANRGFIIAPHAPATRIAACAGAGACTSAHFSTKAVGRELAASVTDLLDGPCELHLSGCAKGCAHPGKAAITVTGAPMGYGIVVNGFASDEPMAYIERQNPVAALQRLDQLVKNKKAAGESAKDCLTRLGTDAIAATLRQG